MRARAGACLLMANVRFPHVAVARRTAEAHTLSNVVLGRWLNDRTRAKRIAAKAVLRQRLGKPGASDE